MIEICYKLLLCSNFNDARNYLLFFSSCVSVVSYINLFDVDHKLSRFYKMARRPKVIGPRWSKLLICLLTMYKMP